MELTRTPPASSPTGLPLRNAVPGPSPRLWLPSTVKPGVVVGEALGTGTLEARIKTTIGARIQEQLEEAVRRAGAARVHGLGFKSPTAA